VLVLLNFSRRSQPRKGFAFDSPNINEPVNASAVCVDKLGKNKKLLHLCACASESSERHSKWNSSCVAQRIAHREQTGNFSKGAQPY
jgi:hypothetical protein